MNGSAGYTACGRRAGPWDRMPILSEPRQDRHPIPRPSPRAMRMNVFGMVTTRHSHAYTALALESFFRTTPLGLTDLFVLIDNDGTYPLPPGGDGPSVTRL